MEIINDPNLSNKEKFYKKQRRGRIITGIVIAGIGVTLMLDRMGYDVPHWVLSWQMLLIVIGFAVGLKHGFTRPGWIIPVIIGGVFLLGDLYPDLAFKHLLLPILFIAIGIFLILRPGRRRGRCGDHGSHHYYGGRYSSEPGVQSNLDSLDITAVFGGVKKSIISTDFKGGEINCVFGGAEVNLMQCDFTGKITLEVNNVLGGTKLIIPSNWQVQSESVAVMGGIEDKRPVGATTDPTKILVLKGTSVLGGLEILSY